MRYLNITSPDINNGLGCRVTLWIAGCTHHCEGCHNPETWSFFQGHELFDTDNNAYKKIAEQLQKPYIKGLTVSGGDPLDQPNRSLAELWLLLHSVKENFPDKDIWIYTGYKYEEIKGQAKEILKECDVLVDGRYEAKNRDITLPFRGSTNQRIIDLPKTFKKGKIIEKEIL